MSTAKQLINRGMGIIEKEVTRLEDVGKIGKRPLLESERDDLCAYMNILHKFAGRDLDEDREDLSELSQDELLEDIKKYVGEDANDGKNNRRSSKPKTSK